MTLILKRIKNIELCRFRDVGSGICSVPLKSRIVWSEWIFLSGVEMWPSNGWWLVPV